MIDALRRRSYYSTRRQLNATATRTSILTLSSGMQLDTLYYVANRLIPPLARIFNLVGADVQGWFEEMPKPQKMEGQPKNAGARDVDTPFKYMGGKKGPKVQKIESHFTSNLCMVCENVTTEGKLFVSTIIG